MAKLYPPYIEGTLPAFTEYGLIVPFILNRAVSQQEVIGFNCKIKTINTNQNLALLTARNLNNSVFNNQEITFTLSSDVKNQLTIGQSYKIQLACVSVDNDQEVEGYYSTVGIAKYTTEVIPTFINNEYVAVINAPKFSSNVLCESVFTDLTERPYSYRFVLLDINNQIVEDSGELLHDITNDVSTGYYYDTYEFIYDPTPNQFYTLKYYLTTINNLRIEPITQTVIQPIANTTFNGTLVPTMNFDNGYISIHLKSAAALNGTYRLVRTAGSIDGSDINAWYPLATFVYNNTKEDNEIFKDFTVTQGYKYSYGFQKIGDALSNRIESEPVLADFEDMFLYDGERQLCIKFNPQVSSFKTNILESKAEAIGSKYPFFFRNGRVEYKEFPINGLISYWMTDEEHSGLFLSDGKIGLEHDVAERLRTNGPTNVRNIQMRTTAQSGYNFTAERTFKLSVLDWLNDGKPKLFRSPGEGTYLVRLMGVSLSPEQQLSRMLHSFSCTAYEIGDTSYKTLINKQNNILRLPEYTINYLQIATIDFSGATSSTNLFNGKEVYSFYIDAISPGLIINYNINASAAADDYIMTGTGQEFIAPQGTPYKYLVIKNAPDNFVGITVTYAYK